MVATCRSALQGFELSGALTLAFPLLSDDEIRLYLLDHLHKLVEKLLAESAVVGPHNASVSQLLFSRATRVLSEGLAAMLIVCRHPPSLWRLLESVWLRLYDRSLIHSVDFLLTQQASAVGATLRMASGPEVRAAVQFAVSLPVYGMARGDATDEKVMVRFGDWSECKLV